MHLCCGSLIIPPPEYLLTLTQTEAWCIYTIHAYTHSQHLTELLPPLHLGGSVAKPGSSCASISMESCKKTCNYFFVCHQINGVFVNNDDLDLIRLQLSRGSIYPSAGRTTGPVETVMCEEWRHRWEQFLFTAFSKESRTDCFIFIFCIVWPGQRGGEARGVQTL